MGRRSWILSSIAALLIGAAACAPAAPPQAKPDARVVATVALPGVMVESLNPYAHSTTQIYPNKWSTSRQVGASPTAVRAGDTVSIPGPGDGFEFAIKPPLGRNQIIAVVVPEGVNLDAFTKVDGNGMRSVDNLDDTLAGIASATSRQVEVRPRAHRAVGTRQFLVVQ